MDGWVGKWENERRWERSKSLLFDDKSNACLPSKNYDITERPVHLVQPGCLIDTFQNPGQQLCCQQFSWVPWIAMVTLFKQTVHSSYCCRQKKHNMHSLTISWIMCKIDIFKSSVSALSLWLIWVFMFCVIPTVWTEMCQTEKTLTCVTEAMDETTSRWAVVSGVSRSSQNKQVRGVYPFVPGRQPWQLAFCIFTVRWAGRAREHETARTYFYSHNYGTKVLPFTN